MRGGIGLDKKMPVAGTDCPFPARVRTLVVELVRVGEETITVGIAQAKAQQGALV